MRVVRSLRDFPDSLSGSSIVLGNFDGVHLGHQHLFARAARLGRPVGVVTFEPHPRQLLAPRAPAFRIGSPADKLDRFAALGADFAMVIDFTREFSRLPAIAFMRDVLGGALAVGCVTVGDGFRFGSDRQGDSGLLMREGRTYGFEAQCLANVAVDGRVCSSSRIRELLRHGAVGEAGDLLGRPWRVDGLVERVLASGETRYAQVAVADQMPPACGDFLVRLDSGECAMATVEEAGRISLVARSRDGFRPGHPVTLHVLRALPRGSIRIPMLRPARPVIPHAVRANIPLETRHALRSGHDGSQAEL